jgi:hypothetical protein
MATTNDITGDEIRSKEQSEKYREAWDLIFAPSSYVSEANREEEEVPIGEDTRPKDRVKLGVSPSTDVEEWDCTGDKS